MVHCTVSVEVGLGGGTSWWVRSVWISVEERGRGLELTTWEQGNWGWAEKWCSVPQSHTSFTPPPHTTCCRHHLSSLALPSEFYLNRSWHLQGHLAHSVCIDPESEAECTEVK